MTKMRYGRMFFYEDLFAKSGILHRLESMDYNTRVFQMPTIYKRAVDMMFEHHTLTYSDFGGFKRFKELILKYEQSLTGVSTQECGVFVGTGISSLIFPTIDAILRLPENQERNEVVLFAPDYALFHSAVEFAGGNPVFVRATRENDYMVTIEQIRQSLSPQTAAIVFSNPNNPLCKTYKKSWVAELITLAKEYNVFIVSDEVYSSTVYQGEFSHVPSIQASYCNYAKLYGLSKDRPGMTGMRTGYYIGDNRLLDYISDNQLVRNFSGNITADFIFLIDIALRYLINSGEKFYDLKYFSDAEIESYFYTIDKNFELQKSSNSEVVRLLNNNKNVIDVIEPEAGNAVFFRYYKTLSADELVHEFISKGLALYPCDVFNLDPSREGSWSRVCVTKSTEFLSQGIAQI